MTHEPPLADELSTVFARMSGLLLSEETLGTALNLVTSLAADTIPATVGAGVTLLDKHGRRTTAAASDPVVERADKLQYELNEGPCLSAWADRVVVRVDEVLHESRWPTWADAVRPFGMRASLSAPLITRDVTLGAIKVYSDRAGAYDERAEHLLRMFASQAAILLTNVQSFQKAQQVSEGLRDALRSRDTISTAKGILMARDGIDQEAAFAILVAVSQRENRKLRDVAQQIVESTMRRSR